MLLQRILAYLRPPPQPTKLEHPPTVYREKCAYYLYLAVRPVDGLDWHDLSEDQRERYRAMVRFAVDLTDASNRTRPVRREYDANAQETR